MEEKGKTSVDRMLEYTEIIRDLYTNQQNLFINKYLNSFESYHDFLNKLYRMYMGNHLFQIGMYRNSDLIITSIFRGRDMYGTEESLERESSIIDQVKLIEAQFTGHPIRRIKAFIANDEELYETIGFTSKEFSCDPYLLFDRITQAGTIYRDNKASGVEAVKQMLDEAKDEPSQEDSIAVISKKSKQEIYGDDSAKIKIVEPYYGPRTLYFLYFANFILNYSETIEKDFVDDLEKIIDTCLEDMNQASLEDRKRYKEVIKVTMKNIQCYKDKLRKKEEKIQK